MREDRHRQRMLTVAVGVCMAIAVCLTFWAYSPALDAPFVLDDGRNIVDSPALHWTEVSVENLDLALNSSLLRRRPVANISFALDHLASGLDPRGFHLTNLLIHIAVGAALLWVCLLYARFSGGGPTTAASRSAFVVLMLVPVTIFLLHPLNTQAVTYVVQRMTSLAAMFSLLAFSCYLMARYRLTSRSHWWCVAAVLIWIPGLASKENAVLVLPVVLLHEICFFRSEWREKAELMIGGTWNVRWTAVTWTGSAVMVALAGFIIMASSDSIGLTANFSGRDFNGLERMLTQCRVQLFHLSQFFWPAPGRLNLDHDFIVSRDLLNPRTTLLALITCFVLLSGAVFLAKRHPRYGFPLLAYALFHSLESGPVNLEIIFEHRMYLPSSMLVLLAAALLVDARPRYRAMILPVLAAFAVTLAGWTHARNQVWADPVEIHRDMALKSPNKSRAQYNFALALVDAGSGDEALPVIGRAIDLDPEMGRLRRLQGEILVSVGRPDEAVIAYRTAVQLEPADVRSVIGLGKALEASGQEDAAFRHYLDTGTQLARGGHPWESIPVLGAAAEIRADDAGVRNALGGAYRIAGLREKAIEQFRSSVELDSGQFEAWYNLGVVAESLGLRDEAILAYQGFLDRAPANLQQPITRARTRIQALSSNTDRQRFQPLTPP